MLPFSLDIELRENVEIERMLTELKKPTKKQKRYGDSLQTIIAKQMVEEIKNEVDKVILKSLIESAKNTKYKHSNIKY